VVKGLPHCLAIVSILLLFSLTAKAAIIAIPIPIDAMAQITISPMESATRAHKLVFVLYVIWLVVAALVTTYFTWKVWSAANAVQDAVRDDALARISEANEKSEQAKATAALAQKEAAEAQLALEKFKAPRVLLLKDIKVLEQIVGALSPYSGTNFDAANTIGDAECDLLIIPLLQLLKAAGWVQVPFQNKNPSALFWTDAGFPLVGSASATNVIIEYDGDKHPELKNAADALAKAISEAGIPAGSFSGTKSPAANGQVIHLLIGKKL
jgi:hypothetical protein